MCRWEAGLASARSPPSGTVPARHRFFHLSTDRDAPPDVDGGAQYLDRVIALINGWEES
jgi:hypothetical protein